MKIAKWVSVAAAGLMLSAMLVGTVGAQDATATPTPSPVNCPRWPILTDPYVNFDPLACVRHPEVTGEKGGKAQVYQEVGANGLDQGFVDTTTAALARALSFYAGNLGQTSVSSSR